MSERCPVFSDPQLSYMRQTIRRSMEDGRERGFVIRGSAEEPRFGASCTGDECSVQIGEHWGEYGDFHTHPRNGAPYPNSADLIGTMYRSHRLICVGADEGGGPTVNCFTTSKYGTDEWYNAYRKTHEFWSRLPGRVIKEGVEARSTHRKQLENFAVDTLMPIYDTMCAYPPPRSERRQTSLF